MSGSMNTVKYDIKHEENSETRSVCQGVERDTRGRRHVIVGRQDWEGRRGCCLRKDLAVEGSAITVNTCRRF